MALDLEGAQKWAQFSGVNPSVETLLDWHTCGCRSLTPSVETIGLGTSVIHDAVSMISSAGMRSGAGEAFESLAPASPSKIESW
jgi:hypothetical protein